MPKQKPKKHQYDQHIEKNFRVDVWDTSIDVIISPDLSFSSRNHHLECKKFKANKYHEAFIKTYTMKCGARGYSVWFKPTVTLSTLCHEAFHLTVRIMCERGVTLDHYNDEPFAYLCGFIFSQLEVSLKDYKIENRKKKRK